MRYIVAVGVSMCAMASTYSMAENECPCGWYAAQGDDFTIDLAWDPGTVAVEPWFASGASYSGATWTSISPAGDVCVSHTHVVAGGDVDYSEYGVSNVMSVDTMAVAFCAGLMPLTCHRGYAWNPSLTQPEVMLCTYLCMDCASGECLGNPWHSCGFAWGYVSVSYLVRVRLLAQESRAGEWVATISGKVTDPDVNALMEDRVSRILIYANESAPPLAWLAYGKDAGQRLAYNLSYSSGEWLYTGSMSGTPQGTEWEEVEFAPRRIEFTDFEFDVNGDGRFNALDATALASLVPMNCPAEDPNDPNYTGAPPCYWDLNADNVINTEDVTYMEQLVAHGFDSGVFGDLNGDGTPDCDARSTIAGMFNGQELGDLDYRIELDADLDADNDTEDRDVFLHVTCLGAKGDLNCDGLIGFDDINALVAAIQGQAQYEAGWPDCNWLNADLNCDGTVTFADQNRWINDCLPDGECTCSK